MPPSNLKGISTCSQRSPPNLSFNKDALIHKLQDKLDKKEKGMDAVVKDALYQFVKFYKEDEFDQLDMMLIVDRFLEDEYDKGKR